MKFIKNRYITWAFLVAFVVLAASFILVYTRFGDYKGQAIVHYDAVSGEVKLGEVGSFYETWAVAVTIVFINGFIAIKILNFKPFFSYVLAFTSLFVSVLIFTAFKVIIAVN